MLLFGIEVGSAAILAIISGQTIMFSSRNDSASARAVGNEQLTAHHNRTRQSETAPSIITSDVVLNGTLTSTGEIQIDGRVDGDVHCVRLAIGASGQVNGGIRAGDVIIRGHATGHIRAHAVRLLASSNVVGDILHQTLVIEEGALFEGNSRHSDNPLAEASKDMTDVRLADIPAMSAAVA